MFAPVTYVRRRGRTLYLPSREHYVSSSSAHRNALFVMIIGAYTLIGVQGKRGATVPAKSFAWSAAPLY